MVEALDAVGFLYIVYVAVEFLFHRSDQDVLNARITPGNDAHTMATTCILKRHRVHHFSTCPFAIFFLLPFSPGHCY